METISVKEGLLHFMDRNGFKEEALRSLFERNIPGAALGKPVCSLIRDITEAEARDLRVKTPGVAFQFKGGRDTWILYLETVTVNGSPRRTPCMTSVGRIRTDQQWWGKGADPISYVGDIADRR